MVNVLVLVNDISPSTIPFEIATQIATQRAHNITVMTFYDMPEDQYVNSNESIKIQSLGADSRFDPSAWRRFHQELRTGEYDVLHTHHNYTGSVARAIASVKNISIVNTEHRQHSSYTMLQNLINTPTLPLADKIVFNSEATQNSLKWYERILLDSEKMSVVYNGVDLARLSSTVKTARENSASPTVLSVGRLVPVKNYATILEAFVMVRERIPDATLILVGDGPERQKIETQATTLGIADAVKFRGKISRDEVYRELASADLFTISSYAEGFCVAAVEAMAAGLPVVVSDIDVFHEVVGNPGVFANPNSPTEFANKITELLNNTEKRRKISQQVKCRARSKFSLERTAQEYASIYKEMASQFY